MKRLFATTLFALFLCSSMVISAHAQSNSNTSGVTANQIRSDINQQPVDQAQFDNTASTPNNFKDDYSKTLNQQSTADKATADKAAQDSTNTTNSRLGAVLTGLLSFYNKPTTSIIRSVLTVFLSLLNLIVTLAGLLFEVIIKLTVTHMKTTVDAIAVIPVIHKSIRDFANMFFIFFLLFESIKLIVGYSDTKKIRTMLIHLVVAALVMNFSLFITKAFVDLSNVAAVGFFQQLPETKFSDSVALGGNGANAGLSGAIMQALKVTSIYSTLDIGNDIKFIAGAYGGIIVMIVLVFMFLAASYLFIRRFVGIILLMIFSPMMIAGWVLPELEEYTKKWWKALTEYCMVAPVFMMLVWIAFKIIQDPGFSKMLQTQNGGASFFAAITNPTVDSVMIIMNFAFVIFFLGTAIVTAAGMGEHGKIAVDWAQKQMGWVGAQTAGRLAKKADDALGNTELGNSKEGRFLRSYTTGLAAKSKYYGAKSYSDLEKEKDAETKEIKEKSRSINFKQRFAEAASSNDSTKVATAIKGMSVKEVVDLGAKKLNAPHVLSALNDSHFEAIEKSDKYSEQEKAEINNARFKGINEAVASGDQTRITTLLKQMNQKQIEKLDPELLQKDAFVSALNTGQYLDLLKSNTLSQEVRDKIKENRIKPLNNAIAGNDQARIRAIITTWKPHEVAQLPSNILTNTKVMSELNKDILTAMIKENAPASTRDAIRDYFTNTPPTQAGNSPFDKAKDWLTTNTAGAAF